MEESANSLLSIFFRLDQPHPFELNVGGIIGTHTLYPGSRPPEGCRLDDENRKVSSRSSGQRSGFRFLLGPALGVERQVFKGTLFPTLIFPKRGANQKSEA